MRNAAIILIILALILSSCKNELPQGSVRTNPNKISIGAASIEVKAIEEDLSNETKAVSLLLPDYKNDFNNIVVNGIDRARIKSIIYSINPEYFNGLSTLAATYSNKNALQSAGTYDKNGYYIPYKIEIYIYNESDSQIKYWILHELKHHYCYIKNNGFEGELAFKHQGCFLDTPIDKEYGFIK